MLKGLFGALDRVAGAARLVVFLSAAFVLAWPALQALHNLLEPPRSIEWSISEAAQRAYENGDRERAERLQQALAVLNEGKDVPSLRPVLR